MQLIKRILKILLVLCCIGLCFIFGINLYVKKSAEKKIVSEDNDELPDDIDCILVLGAGIRSDNSPSLMLKERLDSGISLYKTGKAPKLLMSGDHGKTSYNEVQVMKDIAIGSGIPSSDVFMDHAGFSTYDSIYRAKEIFQAEKIIIVSQEYHLYRALYLADRLGLQAYGVASDTRRYNGQTLRDFREVLARNKDFLTAIVKPHSVYLGEAIPVNGDGNITND